MSNGGPLYVKSGVWSRLTRFLTSVGNACSHHPLYCILGRWTRCAHHENEILKKIGGAPLPEFFENALELQKSKCKNHVKWGPIICKMMPGFQIWPQNSNRITFDLLWAKKLSKIGKIPDLANFDIFCQKGGKCYPIWIMRPDLESSLSDICNRPPFGMIFKFWFLTSHAFLKK